MTWWRLPGNSTLPVHAPAIVTSTGDEPAGTPTGNQPRPTRTTISRPSSSPSGAKLSSHVVVRMQAELVLEDGDGCGHVLDRQTDLGEAELGVRLRAVRSARRRSSSGSRK